MTMREKMARAIALKNNREDRWPEFLPDADAALDALLDETEAMSDAGMKQDSPGMVWSAMIHAAREGK